MNNLKRVGRIRDIGIVHNRASRKTRILYTDCVARRTAGINLETPT